MEKNVYINFDVLNKNNNKSTIMPKTTEQKEELITNTLPIVGDINMDYTDNVTKYYHYIHETSEEVDTMIKKYGDVLQSCECKLQHYKTKEDVDDTMVGHKHFHKLIRFKHPNGAHNMGQAIRRLKAKNGTVTKKRTTSKRIKCLGHLLETIHYIGCSSGQPPCANKPNMHVHFDNKSVCKHEQCRMICNHAKSKLDGKYGELHTMETYNKCKCYCIADYLKIKQLRLWGKMRKAEIYKIPINDQYEQNKAAVMNKLEHEKEGWINSEILKECIYHKINPNQLSYFKFTNNKII